MAPIVDIHTHMYPPEYIDLLSTRTDLPLVRTFPSSPDPRLILLESELPSLQRALADPSAPLPGRSLTKHFTSLPAKLSFMARHGITTSVVSLANPWLDFLSPEDAGPVAKRINESFEAMCVAHPGKLFFFGALPLINTPGTESAQDQTQQTILTAITHLTTLPHCRGIILGTSGLGAGLDDPRMLPIFTSLAAAQLPVFLHPHYGLPTSVFGPRADDYGHVLPLALGFPMETTVAVARMFLAGVFDAVDGLRMILAHSGGTLPFLAGRIESCVVHDAGLAAAAAKAAGKGDGEGERVRKRRTLWEVLRQQIYLDAVVYSDVGLKAAADATGAGAERLMFGTDHPFFPPVGEKADGADDEEWESVQWNVDAVIRAFGEGSKEAELVLGVNAATVLRLDV
ncbi:uncharacterized protein C8A04DRAFT_28620 [Dichotomopilus funicola]|uniref:Amidohydrolase-related domain-containing protein n=1 Tax=Dichotomopilus funicola TaxID=1934379 RepID=A0AAN6V366_9PEZI|nr:hypothetical protein C8A04DRAFT_28620 [Dichotomopilus funicola]